MEVDEKAPASCILVVEDDVLIRALAAEYLKDCGFRVLEASSAAGAIEMAETDQRIDAVFADVLLGGSMDGIRLARWLGYVRPGLPVILTSGDATKAERARHLCAGAPFLPKPYGLPVLAAHLGTLVNARPPHRNAQE